jgi:hypothetical protein
VFANSQVPRHHTPSKMMRFWISAISHLRSRHRVPFNPSDHLCARPVSASGHNSSQRWATNAWLRSEIYSGRVSTSESATHFFCGMNTQPQPEQVQISPYRKWIHIFDEAAAQTQISSSATSRKTASFCFYFKRHTAFVREDSRHSFR